MFGEFGCRGFSSWAVVRSASGNGTATAQRGIEVEWALPRGHANGTECAAGAVVVNATAVGGGFRCACAPGFTGDGFAGGTGCFKCEIAGLETLFQFTASRSNTTNKEKENIAF